MKVTREDVAALAGVSPATVSYVLNGSRNMSDKTRKLVLDAVKQLNYRPDMIARSMKKNETMQLAMIINDIANPFFSEIITGFETAAIEKGYFVNVCTGNKDINNYFENYIVRRIDGVFVAATPYKFDSNKLYDLTENGIKVIVSGNIEADLKRVSSIEIDYMGGMRTAVAYLRKLGHERIVYLSGLSKKHRFDRRIEGFLAAMDAQGLNTGEELLIEGTFPFSTSIEDGFAMTKELIESGREFTAVICTNDLMAIGAVSALESAGLQVPQDVSVMSFDDTLFAKAWRPAITTMAVSKPAFGQKAFELLYTNIRRGTTDYYLNPLELKPRASTAERKRRCL